MPKTRAAHTDTGPLEWLLHSLHHLGWAGAGAARKHLSPVRALPGGGSIAALTLPDGQPLIAVEPAREMPLPAESYEAYEDFSDEHRTLERALGKLGIELRYAVLLSPSGRTQLVDWPNEEVLLATDSRGETADRLLPLLETSAVMRGSLVSHPRKNVSRRAQELEKWTRLWETRMGSALELKRAPVERFFRALHMMRLASRTGLIPADSFAEFGGEGKRPDGAKKLRPLWRRLCGALEFIQGVRADELDGICATAAKNGILADCLASYSRLGIAKFSSEVFAEAFADDELRARSWREAILAPQAPDDDAEARRRPLEPIAVDLDECGHVVMLRAFDLAAEQLRRLRGELASSERHGEMPGVQMEFFSPEPAIPAEDEVAAFALERGVRVRTTQRARADLARMLLLCRAAEWASHAQARIARFGAPAIDFVPPPAPPVERARFSPPPDPSAN